jgi:hypothetical protein
MSDEEQKRQKWEPVERSGTEESTQTNVKEEWNGLYLYLPDELKNKFQLTYKSTSLTYQREFGNELPKMRGYYPLVIKLGMEAIDELDADGLDSAFHELQEEFVD